MPPSQLPIATAHSATTVTAPGIPWWFQSISLLLGLNVFGCRIPTDPACKPRCSPYPRALHETGAPAPSPVSGPEQRGTATKSPLASKSKTTFPSVHPPLLSEGFQKLPFSKSVHKHFPSLLACKQTTAPDTPDLLGVHGAAIGSPGAVLVLGEVPCQPCRRQACKEQEEAFCVQG